MGEQTKKSGLLERVTNLIEEKVAPPLLRRLFSVRSSR